MSADEYVLVVDDVGTIRMFLSRFFEQIGYRALQAEDNDEAYGILARHRVALVTTDLVRPKASGIDFVRQVRKNPEYAHLPIIMITGNASKDVELEAWRSGVTAFLAKPTSFEELLTVVNDILKRPFDSELQILRLGIEGRDLDYKTKIDLDTNAARAEFARDVLGFANSGGGRIVAGVTEVNNQFQWIGLSSQELDRYETTKLNDSIRKYVTSTAMFSSKIVEDKGKLFALITILPADDTIALASQGHQQAGLYSGRIYVRTQDGRTAELSDPLELRRIVDRLVEIRVKKLLERNWRRPAGPGDA